ncbi:MAG: hypothetical protein EXS13_04185 [Planctomycetes bacterium]|nr:hypothetical protein [Planctomycetota bacterium]
MSTLRDSHFAQLTAIALAAALSPAPTLVAAADGAAEASAAPAASSIAIVDVTLIPMDRPDALPHQTVVTRDGTIVAIGPAKGDGAVVVPGDAQRIDGAGRWLLPGLIDNHIHCLDERDLELLLAHGVTTVRNLKGAPWHLELREQIRRGERIGPTCLTAGPFLNEPDFKTPDEFEAAVRR